MLDKDKGKIKSRAEVAKNQTQMFHRVPVHIIGQIRYQTTK
jgi:hypothetical protein